MDAKMTDTQKSDLLHWVSGKLWSREMFVKEAEKLGCCTRIGMLPEAVRIGKTRVFLVGDMSDEEHEKYVEVKRKRHRDRRAAKKAGKEITFRGQGLPRGTPHVFGYFLVRGISYIVGPGVKIPEELAKRGIKAYKYVEGAFGFNDERECGCLQIGGTYLLSEEDIEKIKDLASEQNLEGQIVLIDPAIKLDIGKFRGYKLINGDELLRSGKLQ